MGRGGRRTSGVGSEECINTSLGTSPVFTGRRKGLGTCLHSSCPDGVQLCMAMNTYGHSLTAHCSPQLLSNTHGLATVKIISMMPFASNASDSSGEHSVLGTTEM